MYFKITGRFDHFASVKIFGRYSLEFSFARSSINLFLLFLLLTLSPTHQPNCYIPFWNVNLLMIGYVTLTLIVVLRWALNMFKEFFVEFWSLVPFYEMRIASTSHVIQTIFPLHIFHIYFKSKKDIKHKIQRKMDSLILQCTELQFFWRPCNIDMRRGKNKRKLTYCLNVNETNQIEWNRFKSIPKWNTVMSRDKTFYRCKDSITSTTEFNIHYNKKMVVIFGSNLFLFYSFQHWLIGFVMARMAACCLCYWSFSILLIIDEFVFQRVHLTHPVHLLPKSCNEYWAFYLCFFIVSLSYFAVLIFNFYYSVLFTEWFFAERNISSASLYLRRLFRIN